MAGKKKKISTREARQIRTQQILFSILAILIILVMVVGLFAKY